MYYNKQWGRVPARRPPARLQSGATGTQASAGRESHWRPQHLADIHGNVPSTTLNDVVQQQASVLAYADISYVVATMSFAMIRSCSSCGVRRKASRWRRRSHRVRRRRGTALEGAAPTGNQSTISIRRNASIALAKARSRRSSKRRRPSLRQHEHCRCDLYLALRSEHVPLRSWGDLTIRWTVF